MKLTIPSFFYGNSNTKKLIQLSLPMFLTHIIGMGIGFLCMAMLAGLGNKALAASAFIFTINMAVLHIGYAFFMSLSLLIGRRFGEKAYINIGILTQQGWLVALIMSIPIMLIYWYIDPILIFLGQDEAISKIAEDFFHASMWSILPSFLSLSNHHLCLGVQKQKIDMFISALGMVIFLISTYALIYGKFGLPALGVAGYGYASTLHAWFNFLLSTACLCIIHDFKKFDLFRVRIHKEWHSLIHLFKIGWPISLQVGADVLYGIVSVTFIGWIGTTTLAAYQVVMQYQHIIVLPISAIAYASAILTGQLFGGKQFSDIKQLLWISLRITMAMSITIGLAFVLFPKLFSSLFLNAHNPINIQTLHLVNSLFIIAAISLIFDAIRSVLVGSLRGLLDTKYVMLIGLIGSWFISIPLKYLLAFWLHWGAYGVLIGGMCGILFGTAMLYFRWKLKYQKISLLHTHN